ncbi:hypothetical protein GLV94_04940 [Virgibacillus halodenitrificans]|uniref:DUF4083 domain-containing protein n=1 Tax=Virgibacillus halodenitrificans TaxID=1482 RepID=A0ABR7VU62_VIRHA|nr:hypothetical protein [Virgibacillus halodenitrificans]MBD1224107.1 hypothetical protein [Virgibacillus halodenitrificans]MCG1029048.1 hypothetical protein [Virgibacillus halodenitrificans]MCJ0932479.1 hypothetical protein [Virgibacillus halodenitrificans]MEC2160135.1 hypothetical protein [Virgibacillus halodenitrificans]MYL44980.1 hypothetical protein [Virgibacillus halodenitrificans]
MDIILLFVVGFVGVLIIIMGIASLVMRRVTGPNRDLQKRVRYLENEVEKLNRTKTD